MGATQDNLGTDALSEAGLNTALIAMAGYLDGKGQKIMIQPDLLIVPKEKESTARIILESAGRTATTYTNEINPMYGKLNLFVYQWATDVNDCQTSRCKILSDFRENLRFIIEFMAMATRGKLFCV